MPTSPKRKGGWLENRRSGAEAGKARSDRRLSRAGARADIFRTCGSRAGRATIIVPLFPPTSCHQGGGLVPRSFNGGGDARAISEGVLCLKFGRLTEWPVGGLKV